MNLLRQIYETLFERGSIARRIVIHSSFFLLCVLIFLLLYLKINQLSISTTFKKYYLIKGTRIFFGTITAYSAFIAGVYWKKIIRFLFLDGSYFKRLAIHLSIVGFYSILFIIYHQLIIHFIEYPELTNYYQLRVSRILLILLLAHLIVVIVVKWKAFKLVVKEFFYENGSATHLAIFRILFFYMLGSHLLFYVIDHDISWTYLPETSRVSLPFLEEIIQTIPISPQIFYCSSLIAGIICFFISMGFLTRYLIVLLIPFLAYSLGIPMFFGKISHNHILLWVPLLLCFSPLGDAISLDAFIRKRRKKYNPPINHPKYMLAFKFIWLQIAVIYMFAGVVKLWDSGLNWAIGDNMIYQMQWEWIEHYDKVPGFRIDHYPWLAKLGGLVVIYFEMFYVFLIIKPRTRIIASLGAFSFHLLAGYFMYIDFPKLRFIQLILLRWDKILERIAKKWKLKFNQSSSVFKDKVSGIYSVDATIIIGATIVLVNFIFSLFKIHSYPFSSYPTYSAIVKNEVSLLRMEVINDESGQVDLKKLGDENNFRWENIRPYEIRIIEMFHNKDTSQLQLKLNEYWLLWANNFDELKSAKKVDMFEDVTELAPEKRNIILRTKYIGTVYPEKIDR